MLGQTGGPPERNRANPARKGIEPTAWIPEVELFKVIAIRVVQQYVEQHLVTQGPAQPQRGQKVPDSVPPLRSKPLAYREIACDPDTSPFTGSAGILPAWCAPPNPLAGRMPALPVRNWPPSGRLSHLTPGHMEGLMACLLSQCSQDLPKKVKWTQPESDFKRAVLLLHLEGKRVEWFA